MKRFKRTVIVVLAASALSTTATWAQHVASEEPGWPQWRGPRRDGVSDEKGLLSTWPQGGPKLLWKVAGLGQGYCSPIISRGTIYITGDENETLTIFALDLEGKTKWKTQNGEFWKNPFPGARASCNYSDGHVYHMNAHGRLVCLDAKDGRQVWSVPILERYSSGNITWGISESPLVADGRVFVTPAGLDALMVALDARTGEEVWRTPSLAGEKPSYASAILVDTREGRQIITGGAAHAFGIDAATGERLWTSMHRLDKPVIVTPSYYQGHVVIPLTNRGSGEFYSLAVDGTDDQVEKKWQHELGNPFGSVVCVDGLVVCSSGRKTRGWLCLDAETGRIIDMKEGLRHGSSVYADGRFYSLCSDGKMMLLAADQNELRIVSEFDFVTGTGKKDVWAHPVICDGRLYLRYDDTLYCYDVKKE